MPKVNRSSKSSDPLNALGIAALAAIPIVAGLVPISFLERMPAVCLLRRMGIPCWGCGMTRAVASAARGDLRRAWKYNKLSPIVVPILAWLWWRQVSLSFRAAETVEESGRGEGARLPDSSRSSALRNDTGV